uniref:Uncharacterized protein n=1 Tax=Anguilla anguilla TaxID=7936 RepID=A0A0E9VQ03_ANGAN
MTKMITQFVTCRLFARPFYDLPLHINN